MDVRAFSFEDHHALFAPLQYRHAKPGPRPDHRNRALCRQGHVGAADMGKIARSQGIGGIGHRPEIVEHQRSLKPQLGVQRCRIDHPVRIDEVHRPAGHWPGQPERSLPRQGLTQLRAKRLPRLGQPGVVLRRQHDGVAQRDHLADGNFGERKAGIGAADVGNGYPHANSAAICLPIRSCMVQRRSSEAFSAPVGWEPA